MVFDDTRNRAYAAAIERVVTPDSVVLDLGCGLGIHGLLAARAGARKVFFVDPEVVVHSALEVAQRNGLGDRVQAFQGRIEDIDLPEKVDVIISVFTGNMLYMEDLLPSLFRARDRWLKPGGVLIPDAAQLVVAPVDATAFHDEWIGAWSRPHLGFDFSHLRRFAANRFHAGSREQYAVWPQLAEPQVLVEADLTQATDTALHHRTSFPIAGGGICSGVLGWIRLHLGDAWVGTGPQDPPLHWTPQLMPLDPPWTLSPGDQLGLTLHRPPWGDWTWTLTLGEQSQRHSTFLGQALRVSDLRSMALDHRPRRNEQGEVLAHALALMDGRRTRADIATVLREHHPRRFADAREAQSFVDAIARSHGC
jgi:SAM-dependent methyltransferase